MFEDSAAFGTSLMRLVAAQLERIRIAGQAAHRCVRHYAEVVCDRVSLAAAFSGT